LFVLKYYQKKKRLTERNVAHLQSIVMRLSAPNSLKNVLMLEAEAKKVYYDSFDAIIINADFKFIKRSHYPPKNEINALMSFGYAMIYSRLESSIHRSRLSLELPFVHGYSKPNSGLHHDIADIFKPIFVDRLIFQIINKKMIGLKHFEHKNGGIYLNKTGMNIFITCFEEYMKKTIKIGSKYYSFKQLLSKEVHKISRLVHDGKVYKPYVMTRW